MIVEESVSMTSADSALLQLINFSGYTFSERRSQSCLSDVVGYLLQLNLLLHSKVLSGTGKRLSGTSGSRKFQNTTLLFRPDTTPIPCSIFHLTNELRAMFLGYFLRQPLNEHLEASHHFSIGIPVESEEMVSWAISYFGDELVTKRGIRSTSKVLEGKKFIGVYFGAQWCPPCTAFNPDLVDFYDSANELDCNALEIVFVSSDSDRSSFMSHYEEMPWTAVPYELSVVKDNLSSRFDVRGLPMLIILSGTDGSIKDLDGRATILSAKSDVMKALTKWS